MSEETEEKQGPWETVKDAFRLATGDEEEGGDSDKPGGTSEEGSGEKDDEEKDEYEKAADEVAALEDDPPKDISDWPSGQAKYETFGGSDEDAYDEGATMNLGPPNLRRFPDGSVEIEGEKVENPDDYKGPPIKGGPTDPSVSESEVDPEKGEKVGQEGGSEDGEGSEESDDSPQGESESTDEAESSAQADSSGESEPSSESESSDGGYAEDGQLDSSGEERREEERTG